MHSPFPGFNTLLEGIFWDLFELRRRGQFEGIDVRKMGSLKNRFDLGKEEKVTRGQIEGIWGVFQSCNVPFCKKLTNTQGCVIRSVNVMEPPCASFPKGPHFVTHCLIRCRRMSLRHRSFRIPTPRPNNEPNRLKITHFSDIDSIKMATTTELKKIPENAFQECIEFWKRRMHKCFKVEGNYFEGI